MNKLVSKNPILRFKEGRKIVKAQLGWIVGSPIAGNLIKNFLSDGINKTVDSVKKEMSWLKFKNEGYEVPYNNVGLRSLGKDPDKVTRTFNVLKSMKNSLLPVSFKDDSKSEKLEPEKSGKRAITKKVSTPSSVFAGYKIGKTGGLNYNINDSDKQQLIGTGQFTESDFTNALATQLALNKYFANSGLSSVNEDGAWGDLSRAALALALSKSKSLTPFNNETTIVKTPIVSTYTSSTTPINLEVANLKLNVNVPQQTYDRTGVREFIRNKGINPYSFSGALRRALRMVLNNTADDNDKLLVKGMGLFKQGGQLISKDPIKRFKLKTKI